MPAATPFSLLRFFAEHEQAIRCQLVAIGTVLIAYTIRLTVDFAASEQNSPFLIFPAAIMLSAWYGGWKPGCTAVVLSMAIINWNYLPPHHSFWVVGTESLLRLGLFLAEGAIICALAESLHRNRRFAEHQAIEVATVKKTASQHEFDIQVIQQELSIRDAMLRHLVDANVIGVIVCRLDGKIVDANKAFLKLIEATQAELEAGLIDWRQLTPPEFCDLDSKLIEQLHTTGRFEVAEKEYLLASGKRVPIWLAGAMTPEGDQVICFVMDRTLQKQAEDALIRAKEAAERSNRTRSEFLANISHELRTPMNAILGMTELALDEELPSHIREYLETSIEASRTLLFLLDDLLDFSRMEAGKLELESIPFSLQTTVDQAMRILGLRAAEKGLELVCSIASDVPDQLIGDPGRLRQIILNLVSNAIKFTEHGDVVLSLSRAEAADADPSCNRNSSIDLLLKVTDTGVGISAVDQERIFDPFTQADSSSTRVHGGTGLGLTIVRWLAQRMGGDVSVESQLGHGATFSVRFCLPLGHSDPSIDARTKQLRGLRVLVVDDNHTNRNILLSILSSWSMQCVVVADANAALVEMRSAQQRDQPFEVILVDALMPVMDGLQLIQSASSEGLLHGAPLVMASSIDRRMLESQLQRLPIRGLVGKPISQSELFDTLVETILGSTQDVQLSRDLPPGPCRLRILVAEDAPANRKVVQAILEKRGHHVILAMNGKEAIERIEQEPFDLVLMDLQMPQVDGWAATRVIRQMPSRSQVPIIALTAHAMRGDRERCLAAGMNDYLSKPLDSHQLIRTVERFFSKRPSDPMIPVVAGDQTMHDNHSVREYNSSTIDREGTLERMGGDMRLMRDMAGFFLEDAPALMQTIRGQRTGEDATRAAHSLRGLASNFGAQCLIDPALKIETSKGTSADLEQAINELEQQLPRVFDDLRALIAEQ